MFGPHESKPGDAAKNRDPTPPHDHATDDEALVIIERAGCDAVYAA